MASPNIEHRGLSPLRMQHVINLAGPVLGLQGNHVDRYQYLVSADKRLSGC